MSSAEGLTVPKPGIPKTLGILNVIFGVLLVLMGLCGIVGLAAAPAMFGQIEKIAKEAQSKVEEQEKAQIKTFDDRIAAAKDDEEKKKIEQEKANAIAVQPKIATPDMSAATDVFKDPTIMAVNYAGAISGLVLHILLLVSGIGLIRLAPWGRTLGIWWAALQIVQVIALLVATLVYVMPANQVNVEKQIAKLEAAEKAQGGGPGAASAAQMTKAMNAMAGPIAVGQSLSGMIYPVILLILLSTKGARAACLPKKPMNIDDL